MRAYRLRNVQTNDCDLYIWTTQKVFERMRSMCWLHGVSSTCQTLVWCKTPRGGLVKALVLPDHVSFVDSFAGARDQMPKKPRIDSTQWWNVKRPHNS
jgi:hypothetical protein